MDDRHQNTHADRTDSKTAEPFVTMGLSVFAYAKPAEIEGQPVFTIHAADGSHIGTAPSRPQSAYTPIGDTKSSDAITPESFATVRSGTFSAWNARTSARHVAS